jgi:hypothetical protein
MSCGSADRYRGPSASVGSTDPRANPIGRLQNVRLAQFRPALAVLVYAHVPTGIYIIPC